MKWVSCRSLLSYMRASSLASGFLAELRAIAFVYGCGFISNFLQG